MWMEVIRVEQSWKIKVGRKCWKHKFGKWPHKHPVPSPSCTLSLSVWLMVSRSLSLHFSLCHCFTMISVCFSSLLLWDVNEEHQTIPHLPACLSPTVSPAWLHTLFIWSSYGLHSPPTAIQPKTISSFNFQGKLLNGFWTKQAFFLSPLFFFLGYSSYFLCCLVCYNELPSNKAGGEEINHSTFRL